MSDDFPDTARLMAALRGVIEGAARAETDALRRELDALHRALDELRTEVAELRRRLPRKALRSPD